MQLSENLVFLQHPIWWYNNWTKSSNTQNQTTGGGGETDMEAEDFQVPKQGTIKTNKAIRAWWGLHDSMYVRLSERDWSGIYLVMVGGEGEMGSKIFRAISGIRSFAGCCMDQTQLARIGHGVWVGIAELVERIVLDTTQITHWHICYRSGRASSASLAS